MQVKIVSNFNSKKGKEIIVQYPVENDLQKMWRYINELSKEKTFIRYQGEIISMEDETKFLNDTLKKINLKTVLQLLAFHKEKLVGITGISMLDRIEKHVGVFGISIANGFRGEGIGTQLMQLIINEAKTELPDLRIITLGLFANNPAAFNLYRKFGFKEQGKLPKGIFYKEEYIDHIYMYKDII